MVHVEKRPLKVFLCHASGDKPPVRDLYKRLTAEGVDAWLDKEKLLPGQDWRMEIPRAVREADVVVVCLSKKSVTKEGYVQKEIKFALDIAEEKPEGTIFLIPARLEDCVVPERLNRWQWVDLYEEDGFIKLLRSLKLRADAMGATVEPALYVDSTKELDRKLEQLYTEGLAAFYTEDWERACQRFQSILSEQPSHKHASEKLEEAKRQRTLAKLYEQATGAVHSEDWETAIAILEELSQKSADYKDAAQLLRNARKQRQLKELYTEAKALHAGKQWEAVVKVFDQIKSIDSNYPDSDGLLLSAQKEVAELKRLDDLNDQYSHALREMEAGNWYEARRLLEAIHKSSFAFLETENLLKKVEKEIAREEEKRKQNDQINTLYEQAHGLLRSKKWRNALDKMAEIRKLDEHFPDADGIDEKAQKELAREEQEAERQNKLAAIYAEAVKLLKEEKYQEALDQWGEVKAIDPKYPDRQRVHSTARKALTKHAKPIITKTRFTIPKSLWIGLGGIVAIAILIFAISQFGNGGNKASLAPTKASTEVVVENTASPISTATKMPQKPSTPRSATPTSTTSGYADPTMYDDFDDAQYNGSYNAANWRIYKSTGSGGQFVQRNGEFIINMGENKEVGIDLAQHQKRQITEPIFLEARMLLDPMKSTTAISLNIWADYAGTHLGGISCSISSNKNYETQIIGCGDIGRERVKINNLDPSWHLVRIEIDPNTMQVKYCIDGACYGPVILLETDKYKQAQFNFNLEMYKGDTDGSSPDVHINYVRTGAIEDDPTVYDNFDNAAYDGRFNSAIWTYEQQDSNGSAIQRDGVLVFTQGGIGKSQMLGATQYWPLMLQDSIAFEANLKVDTTSDGHVVMTIEGDVVTLVSCGLHSMSDSVAATCWSPSGAKEITVTHGSWHMVRIEVNLTKNTIVTYIDETKLTEDHYEKPLKSSKIYLNINVWSGTNRVENTRPIIGYVDYVRVYPLQYVNP